MRPDELAISLASSPADVRITGRPASSVPSMKPNRDHIPVESARVADGAGRSVRPQTVVVVTRAARRATGPFTVIMPRRIET
jgi:hypothetical protein